MEERKGNPRHGTHRLGRGGSFRHSLVFTVALAATAVVGAAVAGGAALPLVEAETQRENPSAVQPAGGGGAHLAASSSGGAAVGRGHGEYLLEEVVPDALRRRVPGHAG